MSNSISVSTLFLLPSAFIFLTTICLVFNARKIIDGLINEETKISVPNTGSTLCNYQYLCSKIGKICQSILFLQVLLECPIPQQLWEC